MRPFVRAGLLTLAMLVCGDVAGGVAWSVGAQLSPHAAASSVRSSRPAPPAGTGEVVVDAFHDDGDGFHGAGEPPLAGRRIMVNGREAGVVPASGTAVIPLRAGRYKVEVELPAGAVYAVEVPDPVVRPGRSTFVSLPVIDIFRNDPGLLTNLAASYAPVVVMKPDSFWPVSVDVLRAMGADRRGRPVASVAGRCAGGARCTRLRWCLHPRCIARLVSFIKLRLTSATYAGLEDLQRYFGARGRRWAARFDNPFGDRDSRTQRDAFARYAAGARSRAELDAAGIVRAMNRTMTLYYFAGGGHRPIYRNARRYETFTVQYWMFYTFNDYPVKDFPDWIHEGDWEEVSVRFAIVRRPGGPSGYRVEPLDVRFAHHGRRDARAWGRSGMGARGEHPIAYVANGGHGNYAGCGRQRRNGILPDDVATTCAPRCDAADCLPDRAVACPPQGPGRCDVTYRLVEAPRRGWPCFDGRWGPAVGIEGKLVGTSPYSPMRQQRHYGARLCDL